MYLNDISKDNMHKYKLALEGEKLKNNMTKVAKKTNHLKPPLP